MADGFHDAFSAALTGDSDRLLDWWDDSASGAAGLAIYRNTIARARADVLARAFPSVARLVGEPWFDAAALEFARAHPPSEPAMGLYGERFPDWLAAFPPAQTLPYLAPVARMDRAWSEAHGAPDAPALEPGAAARLGPARMFAARAILHPSVRLFWFDWSAPSIWRANRRPADAPADLVWEPRGEGLLIARPRLEVIVKDISRPAWALLDACRRGETLGAAGMAVLRTDPAADLPALFASLLSAGAFTDLIEETRP